MTPKRSKVKRYGNGTSIMKVPVSPAPVSGDILNAGLELAGTGAQLGSAFGPIGTGVGAVLGLGAGLLTGKDKYNAAQEMRKQQENTNNYADTQNKQFAYTDQAQYMGGVDPTYIAAKGVLRRKDDDMPENFEVEKNEIALAYNNDEVVLMKDFANTQLDTSSGKAATPKTHAQGGMEQGYGEYAKLKEKGYNIAIIPANQRGKFMQRMDSYNSAKNGGDKQTEGVLYKGLVNEINSLPEDFDTKKREGTKNLRIMYKNGVASMQRTSTLGTLQTTMKPKRTVSEIQAAFSSGKSITPEEDDRLIAYNKSVGMSTEEKQAATQTINDIQRQRANRQRVAQKVNAPKLLAVSNQDNEALNKLINENATQSVNSTIDNNTPQTDTDINILYSKYKNGGAVNEAEKQRLLMYMQNNIDSEATSRENKEIGVSNNEPVSITFSDKQVNTTIPNNVANTQAANINTNEVIPTLPAVPTLNDIATITSSITPNVTSTAPAALNTNNANTATLPVTTATPVTNNIPLVNDVVNTVTPNRVITENSTTNVTPVVNTQTATTQPVTTAVSNNVPSLVEVANANAATHANQTATLANTTPAVTPNVNNGVGVMTTMQPKLIDTKALQTPNPTVKGVAEVIKPKVDTTPDIGKSLMGVGNNLLNNMSAYANIAEGYFSKPEVEQAQRFETKPYEYAFSSEPQLKRAADIATVNAYNVGNNAGGNAQLANALKGQVNADLQTSVNSIYSPEVQQANSIRNMNTQQDNTNVYAQNQENARVNDLNAANRAALRNIGRTGVGQLTQYSKQRTADMDLREQVNTQMANQKASQDFGISTLQSLYKNATFDIVDEVDENGKPVKRAKFSQTPSIRTKPVQKELTVKGK